MVTHVLSRFHLPTTQIDRGWMNTNAKTIIDLAHMEYVDTVLLTAWTARADPRFVVRRQRESSSPTPGHMRSASSISRRCWGG